MQWDASANGGFTSGEPWIDVNPNYTQISVNNSVEDPDSVLYFYRDLIRIRKENEVLKYGDFELLYPDDPYLFVYRRSYRGESICVCCNFSDCSIALPEECPGDPVLQCGIKDQLLEPYGCTANITPCQEKSC